MQQATLNEPIETETETESAETTETDQMPSIMVWSDDARDFVGMVLENTDEWNTLSGFGEAAIDHYLTCDEVETDAEAVLRTEEYGYPTSESTLTTDLSTHVHDKILTLIEPAMTPWSTKQEFFLCALMEFTEAQDVDGNF